jgi:3-dehydroquinate synthase
VGIDLPEGKNLAGSFYPPIGVSIPVELLQTLPVNQFANGMAEVWKYGFIMDSPLVELLAEKALHPGHHELLKVVERCVRLKAQVVQADEFETLGLRAILNFGHTVGHAVEFCVGYGEILHGEAISIGMVVEAHLGEMLGITAPGTASRVRRHLSGQGLPVTHEILCREDDLVQSMYGDKKAVSGKLTFSLLTQIGECKLVEDVPESKVRLALRA